MIDGGHRGGLATKYEAAGARPSQLIASVRRTADRSVACE
jgi:hypothetical protein